MSEFEQRKEYNEQDILDSLAILEAARRSAVEKKLDELSPGTPGAAALLLRVNESLETGSKE